MYGKRIKELRTGKGFTQGKLAEMLGFKSASAIGMIEREEREPNTDTLNKLSEIFGVTTDYILGKTVEKMPGELDQLEQEINELYDKIKKVSPSTRQKILKLIEIFDEGSDD